MQTSHPAVHLCHNQLHHILVLYTLGSQMQLGFFPSIPIWIDILWRISSGISISFFARTLFNSHISSETTQQTGIWAASKQIALCSSGDLQRLPIGEYSIDHSMEFGKRHNGLVWNSEKHIMQSSIHCKKGLTDTLMTLFKDYILLCSESLKSNSSKLILD